MRQETLASVILGIDAWLDTMRAEHGYGGPVAHWWQDCLNYTGVGLDWRYEGIIGGYLNLFKRMGQKIWLTKARQAGDDLVVGQLPNFCFFASSFEANPQSGGTPHEAACDLALIKLAHTMRTQNISGWEPYAATAERNIRTYILGQLWMPEERYFRNLVHDPVFVPNKAATIVETLSAWIDFSGESKLLDKYIFPTLERICSCQVRDPNSHLNGAIDQARGIKKREGWFYPYYNARCIPALILGYQTIGEDRYLVAAKAAIDFILRVGYEDGSFPQVIRSNGRIYRYPQWVAGVGDILRAMSHLDAYYPPILKTSLLEWMLQGQLPSGGIRTAYGFTQRSQWSRRSDLPDFRDILAVAGWVDKAFYFLTSLVSTDIQLGNIAAQSFEVPCLYRGRKCTYREDAHQIEMTRNGQLLYRWEKGAEWAKVMH